MPNHSSFNEAVKQVMANDYSGLLSKDPGHHRWNEKLKKFFDRLLHNDEDKLWDDVAYTANKYGISREVCFYRIGYAAAAALFESDSANPQNYKPQALRSRSHQYLRLAQCAESLADHYRRRLKAFGQEDQRSKTLVRWYEDEVKEFQRASNESLEQIAYTSRQSRGKKLTREHFSFIRSLVTSMRRDFGKPHYEAVAAITKIAYPSLIRIELDLDDVRSACRGLAAVSKIPEPSEEELQLALQEMARIFGKHTGKLKSK
jgi:hypothetical protein